MFPATFRLLHDGADRTIVVREGRSLMGPGIVSKEMVFDHPFGKMCTAISSYVNGALIQDAFPFLAPPEREFIMTGTTPAEWDKLFPEEDDKLFPEEDDDE